MFGIAGFGTALGAPSSVADTVAEYSEDIDRILGYGYRVVHRAAPDVQVTDLAHAAAKAALDEAGITAGEVDLVVLALTDLAEYLYWDAAAALQLRLGASNAEAVLISQACTATLAGLTLVAGRFAIQPDYRTALVIGANRCCEQYWNRMQTQSMVFSDGATAAVLRRDHGGLRWRAAHAITDGRFADFYRMDVGGAAEPFIAGQATEQPSARDAWDIMEFFDYDDEQFDGFARMIDARTREVVDQACQRAGVRRDDLSRVLLLHDNRRAVESMAAALGVPLERTNAEIGLSTGHLGAADQLYSLQRLQADGALAAGDLVALVGMGRGMHWACTLIEV
jgi:3-oxoacyl-[acyl-carrier-protein] synthase-3